MCVLFIFVYYLYLLKIVLYMSMRTFCNPILKHTLYVFLFCITYRTKKLFYMCALKLLVRFSEVKLFRLSRKTYQNTKI